LRVSSSAWTIVCDTKPAPDTTFVSKIFFAEFSFEITFLFRNHESVRQDEADWRREKHPHRIQQERDPERPQTKTEIHRVPTESIKPMRNDPRRRMKWDRIGPRSSLSDKTGDIQDQSGHDEQRANDPPQRTMNETDRHKAIANERHGQRKNKQKRRRNHDAGFVFVRWKLGRHEEPSRRNFDRQFDNKKRRAPSFPKTPFIFRWR